MNVKTNTQSIKSLVVAALLLVGITAQAQTINPMPKVSDDWRFSGAISAWAPASWTTTSVGRLTKSSETSISDNISSAGSMAMLTGEAHKGNWGLMADLVYWQMGGNGAGYIPHTRDSVYAGANGKMTQTMLTVAGTYTAYNSPALYLDGLAGARYITSTTTINSSDEIFVDGSVVHSSSASRSFTNQTTDPVIGFKGRARISNTSWFVPFYADAGKGPGGNNTTWQTSLGVGNAYSWGDITLAYRAMYFDLKSQMGVTKYLNAGPQLSATMNF